jgi:hypothetical protein
VSRTRDERREHPGISDEELMRYADGVASTEERNRIDEARARDPGVARRLACYTRTASCILAPPFDPILDAPVPERLLAAATGRTTPAAAAAGRKPATGLIDRLIDALRRSLPSGPTAIGVALALAAVAGLILAGPGLRPMPGDAFGTALETAESRALITFSSSDGPRTLTPILTFQDKAQRFCRVYELTRSGKSTLTGIACREAGTWQTVFESDSGALPSAGQVAPAGSDVELNRRLEEMRGGDALGREEEVELLRKGWKPREGQ